MLEQRTKDILERRVAAVEALAKSQPYDVPVRHAILPGQDSVEEGVNGRTDHRQTDAPEQRLLQALFFPLDQRDDYESLRREHEEKEKKRMKIFTAIGNHAYACTVGLL